MQEQILLPSGANNSDFRTIVNESREKIHQTEIIEPPKRSRGRPAGKYGHYKKREQTSSTPPPNQNPEKPEQDAQAAGVDVSQLLIKPLQILSQIPARQHKLPELALTDDESKCLAESLTKVLEVYAPDVEKMSPKTAAILMLGINSTAILISKYEIYAKRQAEIAAELAKQNEATNAAGNGEAMPQSTGAFDTVAAAGPGLDAGEYFKKSAS